MSTAICEQCVKYVGWSAQRGSKLVDLRCSACKGPLRSINSFVVRRVRGRWMLQGKLIKEGDVVEVLDGEKKRWITATMKAWTYGLEPIDDQGECRIRDAVRWPR